MSGTNGGTNGTSTDDSTDVASASTPLPITVQARNVRVGDLLTGVLDVDVVVNDVQNAFSPLQVEVIVGDPDDATVPEQTVELHREQWVRVIRGSPVFPVPPAMPTVAVGDGSDGGDGTDGTITPSVHGQTRRVVGFGRRPDAAEPSHEQ